MDKLNEYQIKKEALETELAQVNRNIIITEQSISQQEEIFNQQFQTTDPVELQKIAEQYNVTIQTKEAELLALENLQEA